jgi:hypothetical protein
MKQIKDSEEHKSARYQLSLGKFFKWSEIYKLFATWKVYLNSTTFSPFPFLIIPASLDQSPWFFNTNDAVHHYKVPFGESRTCQILLWPMLLWRKEGEKHHSLYQGLDSQK